MERRAERLRPLDLDKLPAARRSRERVTEIMSAELVSYWGVDPSRRQVLRHEGPAAQAAAVPDRERLARRSLAASGCCVDPNEIDKTGGTSIDWFQPSPDGKLVAVSLSHGGSEAGDVFVYDVATGKQVGEVIPRVNTGTAGGDLAWAPDGTGFYYTRHPREGERPAEDMNFYQQVYFHKLGTPTADDRYELGKDSPRIAETELKVDERTGRVLATVQNGDGGEFAHYLRDARRDVAAVRQFEDKIIQAAFGPDDDLFVVSRQDAPRGKIVRVPIAASIDVRGRRGDRARGRGRDRHLLLAGLDRADDRVAAVRGLPARRTVGDSRVRPRRQAAARRRSSCRCRRSAISRGWRATTCCSRTVVRPAGGDCIATTPRRARSTKTALKSERAGGPRRRRSRARVRHVEGRHEGAGEHHLPQGDAARRHRTRRWSPATAATA